MWGSRKIGNILLEGYVSLPHIKTQMALSIYQIPTNAFNEISKVNLTQSIIGIIS